MGTISTRFQELVEHVRSNGRTAIAFSGGVDSTFLARAAREAYGDGALAITVVSGAYPPDVPAATRDLAAIIGIRLIEVEADIETIPNFCDNPPDRCYHCKRVLFTLMIERAACENVYQIMDGSNSDDTADFRPGHRALRELDVLSPLRELGFDKAEIRSISRELDLPTWNMQSYACLASRFPYGDRITLEGLERTWRAEAELRDLGLSRFRVRNHGDIARIEVEPDQVRALTEPDVRDRIVSRFKALGYTYIALDLEGYRTGSLNEVLGSDTVDGDTGT
jgi:pyridinium-3,5-biscarboxylic acid mononucleotide sulfurtransferase